MKRAWNSPEVEELTIQATSCTGGGWYGGGYYRPSRPSRPSRPGGGGRPGFGGGCGGDDMSPDWKHPEDETSSC